jgi:pimeloyl-ACP methyl ester carboxylesterase
MIDSMTCLRRGIDRQHQSPAGLTGSGANRFRVVRRILSRAIGASVAALAVLGACTAVAQAAIDFAPCSKGNDFACAHLSVPLDPSGVLPGSVSLAIKRHRAAVGEAHSAIIALAGGPGQSALPFAEQFAELLGPVAATRDLIVFDQRGTGKSGALACHAFERLSEASTPGKALAECATQLGPSRTLYTSADTVADIEAIRRAGGYEKLVLYGTSYGTKVAELYAQEHPEHVEALVLDSVVPPNGPDTFNRSTFAAIPRVLRQICAGGACYGLTANPVADLARLLRRMRHGPLHARAFGPAGHARTVLISPEGLLDVLLMGDFSGGLRAELVTTVRAAARGDMAPIARLFETLHPSEDDEEEDFDGPLYFATTCEEQQFPFSRTASPAERLSESIAAADSHASDFLPFSAADAIGFSDIPSCIHWHYSTPAPATDQAPFPAVPTLILSGADDLRTPTANAREVAAQIPGSQLLVVPYVGHSVLGEDPTSCAQTALQALFASGHVKACRAEREPARLRPASEPPRTLAQVPPASGYSGLPGRTAKAFRLTLADLGRQLNLMLESSGSIEDLLSGSALSTGGLRSGWASLGIDIDFHDYSFVPGVTISGRLGRETAALRIGGSAAATGTLHMGSHRMLVGELGGTAVRLPASPKAAAAIVGADAPASAEQDPGDPAARARARLLARRLERILGP